jgi:hypothetical protein
MPSKWHPLFPVWSFGYVAYSDLNENIAHNIGLRNRLVDAKECALDDRWSGLRFVSGLRIVLRSSNDLPSKNPVRNSSSLL